MYSPRVLPKSAEGPKAPIADLFDTLAMYFPLVPANDHITAQEKVATKKKSDDDKKAKADKAKAGKDGAAAGGDGAAAGGDAEKAAKKKECLAAAKDDAAKAECEKPDGAGKAEKAKVAWFPNMYFVSCVQSENTKLTNQQNLAMPKRG